MAKLYINNNSKLKEVVLRIGISKNGDLRNVMERFFIDPITNTIKLIWEYIYSFIFTSDEFGIQTSDGYIIKLKDQ